MNRSGPTAKVDEPSKIDKARVLALIQTMEPSEIAHLMGVQVTAITTILAKSNTSQKWLLICLRTRRTWPCWSERACYFRAQLFGLSDYNWGRAHA